MDIQFGVTYIIIPVIVGAGILSGKMKENYRRTGMMICFKSCIYLYCALANIINYLNDTWAIRYIAGLTIALSIMECLNALADGIIELRKSYAE